jgi:HEAT repeat protein
MAKRSWLLLLALALPATPARAYVDAAPTLRTVIEESTNIVVLRVDKVSREKRVIIYTKVADLKGTQPDGPVKHLITDGFHPREPKLILDWAEPGRVAVCFHNGKVAQTCLGPFWYESAAQEAPWWRMTYGRWDLSLAYAGSVEKLRRHVADMLDGKEVVITAAVHGAHGVAAYDAVMYKNLFRGKEQPVWRIKASLKMPGSVAEVASDPKWVVGLGAGGPEDVPALLEGLRSGEARARVEAADDLGLIGPPAKDAVPALRAALKDTDGLVRARAAGALARIEQDSQTAVPALLPLLRDPAAATRRTAANVLGEVGPEAEEAVPALVAALRDEDAGVRWAAAEALGRIGPDAEEAVPALAAALSDPAVHAIAIDALGGIGSSARAVVPALLKDFDGPDPVLRRLAALALVRIDPSAARVAVPFFIDGLKSLDERARWDAVQYLSTIGPPAKDAAPALLDVVRTTSDGVTASALVAVAGPDAKGAIPTLLLAMKNGWDTGDLLT